MEGESNKMESPWFRHFLASLNETFVPPTAKTMSKVYEHRIHVFILHAQLQSLERALAFFTVDGGTFGPSAWSLTGGLAMPIMVFSAVLFVPSIRR